MPKCILLSFKVKLDSSVMNSIYAIDAQKTQKQRIYGSLYETKPHIKNFFVELKMLALLKEVMDFMPRQVNLYTIVCNAFTLHEQNLRT